MKSEEEMFPHKTSEVASLALFGFYCLARQGGCNSFLFNKEKKTCGLGWVRFYIQNQYPLCKGCLLSRIVFHQRLSSIKEAIPSNVIIHQRLSSIIGCLLSKVVFHQKWGERWYCIFHYCQKKYFHANMAFFILWGVAGGLECQNTATSAQLSFDLCLALQIWGFDLIVISLIKYFCGYKMWVLEGFHWNFPLSPWPPTVGSDMTLWQIGLASVMFFKKNVFAKLSLNFNFNFGWG